MNRTHSARFTTRPLAHSLRPRVITKARHAITASGASKAVSVPRSAENTFASNQRMRVFAERLNYTLPAAITVDAQGEPSMLIPQGTKVNIYLIDANRAGDQSGTVRQLVGSAKFNTTILAVLTSRTMPHAGITAAYSASGKQGIGYGDSVSVYPEQNRVELAFDMGFDQVRIITIAQ